MSKHITLLDDGNFCHLTELRNTGLMPENPPPAQYEDVAAAYTHLIKNMNVDPKKIIMGVYLFRSDLRPKEYGLTFVCYNSLQVETVQEVY